jgi:hypothetical protein
MKATVAPELCGPGSHTLANMDQAVTKQRHVRSSEILQNLRHGAAIF